MRKTIAVIGEGITEKYYIQSLKGLSPFDVMPRELGIKASSLKSLSKDINLCINKGFDEVYCLIDMDGKTIGKAKNEYLIIKNKYHNNTFYKKSMGLETKVFFIETERCTELWFLYYFSNEAITRKFNTYKELEKELRKYRPDYEKTTKYFKSQINIHQSFEEKTPKGSIIKAYKNSKSAIASNIKNRRGYSYSEMHLLIKALGIYSEEE
jgi:hypothetical protein